MTARVIHSNHRRLDLVPTPRLIGIKDDTLEQLSEVALRNGLRHVALLQSIGDSGIGVGQNRRLQAVHQRRVHVALLVPLLLRQGLLPRHVWEGLRNFGDLIYEALTHVEEWRSNIVAGLPGANDSWSLADVRGMLETYRSIDATKLRDHLIEFLEQVVPVDWKVG